MNTKEIVKKTIHTLLDEYSMHYGEYINHFTSRVNFLLNSLDEEKNDTHAEHLIHELMIQIEGHEYKLRISMNAMNHVISEEIKKLITLFPNEGPYLRVLLKNQLFYIYRYRQQMESIRSKINVHVKEMPGIVRDIGVKTRMFREQLYEVSQLYFHLNLNTTSMEAYLSRLFEGEIHRCLSGHFPPKFYEEIRNERLEIKKEKNFLNKTRDVVEKIKNSIHKAVA